MNKNKLNDGIGNHPESQKMKDICDISPKDSKTKEVCQPLNQYRKKIKNK